MYINKFSTCSNINLRMFKLPMPNIDRFKGI